MQIINTGQQLACKSIKHRLECALTLDCASFGAFRTQWGCFVAKNVEPVYRFINNVYGICINGNEASFFCWAGFAVQQEFRNPDSRLARY
jgi:hypothetical protein